MYVTVCIYCYYLCRSSHRREKRELSRTPSPLDNRAASPSRSSSKRSKRSKKEKKKRHRRSPSYSVSPTPSAESESLSPSPAPAVGMAGSMSWGSDEDGGEGDRMEDERAPGQHSSGAESDEERIGRGGSGEEDSGEGERDSGRGEDSEREESFDRDISREEELSDVE